MSPGGEKGGDPYVTLARRAVESHVTGKEMPGIEEAPPELFERRAGVFVCIKKRGVLRGCTGTINPVAPSLAEEIRSNAVNSATADPRFPPVDPSELQELSYSVDVLDEPEEIAGTGQLDPSIYGVIVRSGNKSGLLLPDLPGVGTSEEQVSIALQKAGISQGEPVKLFRFRVIRHE